MNKTFKVGQKVWFEPRDKRDKGCYMTISKVGRKYYTVEPRSITFSKETLFRGTYPDGTLYSSEQEAKDYKKAHKMLNKISYMYNLEPTLTQMTEIYKILGLEIPGDD